MTTRPVARSTAMTDHVANAEAGKNEQGNQGKKGSFHGRQSYANLPCHLRLLRPSFVLTCAMRNVHSSSLACSCWPPVVRRPRRRPTFAKDVAPIFYSKCVECHRPTMFAPMSLVKFDDARPWAKSIRNRVATRTMPPWGADPAARRVQERSAPDRTRRSPPSSRGSTAARRRATTRTCRRCRRSSTAGRSASPTPCSR